MGTGRPSRVSLKQMRPWRVPCGADEGRTREDVPRVGRGVDEMVSGVRDRASDDDTPVSGSARETRRQSVGSVPRRKKLRDPEYP